MKVSQYGTLQEVQSQKATIAMMKLAPTRTCHRKGRPRVTSAAEEKFIRVTSLRNCSPNRCFADFK
jgi:hypothetical protein